MCAANVCAFADSSFNPSIAFDVPKLRVATEERCRAHAAIPVALDGDLLTEREAEVLELVAGGMRNHEIAQALWIAPGTVKKHLDNVYAKLGVRNRTAATTSAPGRLQRHAKHGLTSTIGGRRQRTTRRSSLISSAREWPRGDRC
jgi:DNA-binding NarL/FixJ family response regulator